MTKTLFKNARIFDGITEECPEGMQVLVEDGIIREVTDRPIAAANVRVIDVGGRTLMPGLIDAHIHAYSCDITDVSTETYGEAYRTAHAIRMLGHALDCGFTTVRDVGGGDYGLSRAIADGLVRAPRFFYAGKHLSITGGHGDIKLAHEIGGLCGCGAVTALARVADGVDGVIHAARDELRCGAHCIKILASGGVISPCDPVWMNQYSEEEIRAVVRETEERRTYTTAHCHPVSAIRRCINCGVRCIEHGTLMDSATAKLVASTGTYVVPTIVIIFTLVELGESLGIPPTNLRKAREIYQHALVGLDHMRQAGVKVGFGTDLLGKLYTQQCREFLLRREVFSPLEILRQATSMSADLMMQGGKLGCVSAGAYADLIVVDGDPLEDIGLLAQDGRCLSTIMRGGEIIKHQE